MINRSIFLTAASRGRRPAALAARTVFVATLLFLAPLCPAQTPDDGPIRDLITRLDRGETEAVRQALPEAVTKYQNHPGILYLQARVATDGIEAAKLYQSVLDNYPASEWADDALFNLYQYYYAMGLYKTAELRMQQLRKEYPGSEHLAGKGSNPPNTGTPTGSPSAPVDSPPVTPAPGVKTVPSTQDRVTTKPPPTPVVTDNHADADTAARGAAGTTSPEAESPASVDPAERPSAAPTPYTLQTGAFSTSENAQKQKTWFEELGYTAEITNRVRSGKSLFLVWVGSYASADDARKALREIQSRYNITPIVVER